MHEMYVFFHSLFPHPIVVWEIEILTIHSDKAVTAVVNHLNAGNQVTAIHTTCHAGTHRSVAVAEIIAQKMWRGVNAVVTHKHRRRGPGDGF